MIDSGCVGMGENTGWEVVIELVDKLWGIDDPKVKDAVGWAEGKLGEIGCSASGEIGGRPAPRDVRGGTKRKVESSPDRRRPQAAGSIEVGEKYQIEDWNHWADSHHNPGLEAAFLRHALGAESVLEATEVQAAMANAFHLYAKMRGL